MKRARQIGDLWLSNRILGVLNFVDGWVVKDIASMLKVCVDSVRQWIGQFLCSGVAGLKRGKSPGRPPKLTKSDKRELAKLIDKGPAKAGFCGNCWRSPMIQKMILDKFGVFYSVHYISQLLKAMGFSFQKARFVSDHLNKDKRKQWLEQKFSEILATAKRHNAYLLFGDEASFAQWGSLSYTWARKGQQPTVETSGKRKGYKVFGLIDYFTGKFFYKCQEQRLNSETYAAFLEQLLAKTRKHIVLVQDGASYHTSAAMKAFFEKHKHRLTVYRLPSYSPDFNPIEKLWKKIKEKGTHLHYFPTFDALMNKVHESLMQFKSAPKEVLALFGMYYKIDHAA
ncbi:MAG: IS630 family transposase [Ketobacter sp.]|nr:IS630 family transposase [Ketobacter sp.]